MTRKRGRPPKAPGDRRSVRMVTMLTHDEARAIRASARRGGFTVSGWVRFRSVDGKRRG